MIAALRIVLLLVLVLFGGPALATAQSEYDSYLEYFNQNEDVKEHTLDALSLGEKFYFWQFIVELKEKGKIAIQKPKDLGKDYFTDYTENEVSLIIAAKYAHAVWLDKNNVVSWDLGDYSKEELSVLFSKDSILESGDRHALVSDFSPSDLFERQKHLIQDSSKETIFTVLEEYRDTFRHGLVGEPLKELSQDIVSLMDKNEYGQRVSYSGCHSMSKIVESTLRNFNIPAYEGYTRYGGGGHASIFFPTLNKVALHGDDIYSAGKKGVPFEAMMMDVEFLEEIEQTCAKKDRECNDNLIHSWEIQQMLPYMKDTKYHVQHCCRRDFGHASCEEYVDSLSHAKYLTISEKEWLVDDLKSVC